MNLNKNEKPLAEVKNTPKIKEINFKNIFVNSVLNATKIVLLVSPIILACTRKGKGFSEGEDDFLTLRY